MKKEITEAPCLAHFDPKKDNFIITDACITGLGATLWQREGKIFRPVAFASKFLTDCERKYAINELEFLGALWGLEYFRNYVYGKKVNLLTDHQALEPLLKRNRAHKQHSARLTRQLDRLTHFDVNVQYTAGKNIPLTDYLSRHPIAHDSGTETSCAHDEKEAEEEFVISIRYTAYLRSIARTEVLRNASTDRHQYQNPTNHGTVYKRVNKLRTDIQFKQSYREKTINQQILKTSKSIHRQNRKRTK